MVDGSEIMQFAALPRPLCSLQQDAFALREGNTSKLPSPHPLLCPVC